VKHVLLGCAAALALSLAAPVAALADNPPSDVDAAHAARVRADADLAKTKQETKAAITNSANHRTHRIATVAQRRQRQIAASAKTRKAHIANDADAQKKAIDAQHP
jgi:hypothetical protein